MGWPSSCLGRNSLRSHAIDEKRPSLPGIAHLFEVVDSDERRWMHDQARVQRGGGGGYGTLPDEQLRSQRPSSASALALLAPDDGGAAADRPDVAFPTPLTGGGGSEYPSPPSTSSAVSSTDTLLGPGTSHHHRPPASVPKKTRTTPAAASTTARGRSRPATTDSSDGDDGAQVWPRSGGGGTKRAAEDSKMRHQIKERRRRHMLNVILDCQRDKVPRPGAGDADYSFDHHGSRTHAGLPSNSNKGEVVLHALWAYESACADHGVPPAEIVRRMKDAARRRGPEAQIMAMRRANRYVVKPEEEALLGTDEVDRRVAEGLERRAAPKEKKEKKKKKKKTTNNDNNSKAREPAGETTLPILLR